MLNRTVRVFIISFAPAGAISGEQEFSAYLAASLPVDGASDVPLDSRIVLRFSKPLRAETINSESVSLTASQARVETRTVLAESGRLLFVSARERLQPDTTYTLYGLAADHSDGLGSTLGLADTNGAVQIQYSYDAFGATIVTGQSNNNSSQYTGRENDQTGLYYNRSRYYSPQLQRFISEDPIGMTGGINLYAYVGNNPISFSDPSGLDKSDLSWRLLAHGAQFAAGFGDTITAYPAQFELFLGPGSVTGTIRGWTPGRAQLTLVPAVTSVGRWRASPGA